MQIEPSWFTLNVATWRSYFDLRHACMPVIQDEACSGQIGVYVLRAVKVK